MQSIFVGIIIFSFLAIVLSLDPGAVQCSCHYWPTPSGGKAYGFFNLNYKCTKYFSNSSQEAEFYRGVCINSCNTEFERYKPRLVGNSSRACADQTLNCDMCSPVGLVYVSGGCSLIKGLCWKGMIVCTNAGRIRPIGSPDVVSNCTKM